jgi:hypothetical protein
MTTKVSIAAIMVLMTVVLLGTSDTHNSVYGFVVPRSSHLCRHFRQSKNEKLQSRNYSLLILTQESRNTGNLLQNDNPLDQLQQKQQHAEVIRSGNVWKETARAFIKKSFPSIPEQEVKDTGLCMQFRPRFIARELLLGARLACLAIPTITIVDTLTTYVRRMTFPLFPSTWLGILNTIPDNIIDPLMLSMVFLTNNISSALRSKFGQNISAVTWGPVVEEIEHSAVGYVFGKWVGEFFLSSFVILCHILPSSIGQVISLYPAIAMAAIYGFSAIVSSNLSHSLVFIYYAGMVAIPTPAFDSIGDELSKEDKHSNRQHLSSMNDTKQKYPSGLITSCMESMPPKIQKMVEKTTSTFAVWFTAYAFGCGHFPISNHEQYAESFVARLEANTAGLQNIARTAATSILAFLRLASKRRTLWGAIGAHLIYNILADLYSWLYACTSVSLPYQLGQNFFLQIFVFGVILKMSWFWLNKFRFLRRWWVLSQPFRRVYQHQTITCQPSIDKT